MESEFESLKIESAPTPKTFSAYKVSECVAFGCVRLRMSICLCFKGN